MPAVGDAASLLSMTLFAGNVGSSDRFVSTPKDDRERKPLEEFSRTVSPIAASALR